MVAPASETIAEQFHITSQAIVAMTTSIFILGYGEYQITPRHSVTDPIAAIGPLVCPAKPGACTDANRVSFSVVRTSERIVWSLSSSATRQYVVSWFVPSLLSRI